MSSRTGRQLPSSKLETEIALKKIDPDDLSGTIRRCVELLGKPSEILPQKGSKVLIKPNLGWNKPWWTGTTTSPHFVEAIVGLLEETDPSKIIVGESPSIGMESVDGFQANGFDRLEERGVELLNLGRDELVETRIPGESLLGSVLLPRTYLECDFFINVPVVKTHVNTCVTLSMKNLKGLLPSREKKRFHFLGLDRCIAELASVIRHGLIIVDGEVGQEGMGPISGDPVELGVVVCGRSPLLVDATCIEIMGMSLNEVKHLEIAEEIGLQPSPMDAHLLGDPISSVSRLFKSPPKSLDELYPGIRIVSGRACSGCVGSLSVSLQRMKDAGELDILEEKLGSVTIAVGPGAEVPKDAGGNLLIVGNCLKRHRSKGWFVPGCSPQGWFVRDVLRVMMGLEPLFASPSLMAESIPANDRPRDDYGNGG